MAETPKLSGDTDSIDQFKAAVMQLPGALQQIKDVVGMVNKLFTDMKRMEDWRDRHTEDSCMRDKILTKHDDQIRIFEKHEYGTMFVLRTVTYISATLASLIAIFYALWKVVNS